LSESSLQIELGEQRNIPRTELTPNTAAFEHLALIKASGFREYDARWLFEKEINLAGIQLIGLSLGTMLRTKHSKPSIVVGHDYRSYSSAIKFALISGLLAAGCEVHDIGMCTTPMAYYAQFALDVNGVAMITASHNENGWTGIKMGMERPLTFGPAEINELKRRALTGDWSASPGGILVLVDNFEATYRRSMVQEHRPARCLRVAAVCGNGTAGAFAPQILRDFGCEVTEIDCDLDYTFPNYNPNPEDLVMLGVMRNAVKEHGLDLAFGFDGDGDRCGIVDNEGNVIFSDKLGLMIARDIASNHPGSRFVVDVKSTGLFKSDPVLTQYGASVDYWKTGHSYIKQRTTALGAIAGFEKSGHFFFRPPFGHGYDDGILSALHVCRLLDHAPDKSLADLYRALPVSFTTPSMSPHCDDDKKYVVMERLTEEIQKMADDQVLIGGGTIVAINTINGVRFEFEDGSWGLVRASSNKPELVVVCESLKSEQQMQEIFSHIKTMLSYHPEIGAFNQQI
jgi:phosphomannomutase / phosphoglucomutase